MDDRQIASLICSGAEDGYRMLVDDVLPRAKGALIKRYGRQLETEIEDGLAEALRSVWMSIEGYDPDRSSLATWVYVIARNAMVSSLRQRPKTEFLGERPATSPDPLSSTEDPGADQGDEVDPARQKRLEDLRACISRLSPMQRDIVYSDLEHGSSSGTAHLAERWETTTNSIRVSRHKAHRRLRRLMERMP